MNRDFIQTFPSMAVAFAFLVYFLANGNTDGSLIMGGLLAFQIVLLIVLMRIGKRDNHKDT